MCICTLQSFLKRVKKYIKCSKNKALQLPNNDCYISSFVLATKTENKNREAGFQP